MIFGAGPEKLADAIDCPVTPLRRRMRARWRGPSPSQLALDVGGEVQRVGHLAKLFGGVDGPQVRGDAEPSAPQQPHDRGAKRLVPIVAAEREHSDLAPRAGAGLVRDVFPPRLVRRWRAAHDRRARQARNDPRRLDGGGQRQQKCDEQPLHGSVRVRTGRNSAHRTTSSQPSLLKSRIDTTGA